MGDDYNCPLCFGARGRERARSCMVVPYRNVPYGAQKAFVHEDDLTHCLAGGCSGSEQPPVLAVG